MLQKRHCGEEYRESTTCIFDIENTKRVKRITGKFSHMGRIFLFSGDSRSFLRGRGKNLFRGCIGCCLGFEDPGAFKNEYRNFMTSFLDENGVQTTRIVHKSYDVSRIFRDEREGFLDFLERFTLFVDSQNVKINVVYSTLNPSRLTEGVKLYGASSFPIRKISSMEFLNLLDDYFLYISVWKVLRITQFSQVKILLDDMQGEITNSWNELVKGNIVNVVPRGDSCNCYISSADMIARFVDEKLKKERLRLQESDIRKILRDINVTESSNVLYVGHPDLKDIVPIIQRKLPLQKYYTRPLVFVLKEGTIDVEREYIEESPHWEKLLAFASLNDTGIKFLDYKKDRKVLRDGDFLVYIGDKGKEQAKYLIEDLGFNYRSFSISQIETVLKDAKKENQENEVN